MSTRPAGRLVRSAGVLWRWLPDGVLLLTPQTDEPLAVRGSAAGVWAQLVEPVTAEELVAGLLEEPLPAELDRSTVVTDVEGLLRSLVACGAVEPAD